MAAPARPDFCPSYGQHVTGQNPWREGFRGVSAATDEAGQIGDGNLARDGEPVAEIVPESEAELGTGLGQAEEGVTTLASGIAVGPTADPGFRRGRFLRLMT